ncbi:hypothetical protein DAI22_11g190300 [Oryza sativa Japonica Group]|nr:hypothetical protein DAI22_11g190300 [Oryza sativa Japonica Group]
MSTPTEHASECASGSSQRYSFSSLHFTCHLLVESKGYANGDLKKKGDAEVDMSSVRGTISHLCCPVQERRRRRKKRRKRGEEKRTIMR